LAEQVMREQNIQKLFQNKLSVLNIGLPTFGEALRAQGVGVVQVDWRPPAGGDLALAAAIEAVLTRHSDRIATANEQAVAALLAAKPMLVGVGKAQDVIPGMRPDLILHAGPPVTWAAMSGPTRGAVIGGLIYEGRAKTQAEAEALAASGKITFEPCHHHQAVGPMAGVVTPSMPVWIFENTTTKNQAFITFNEGLGKVLRYGAFGDEVQTRLRWMADVLAPLCSKAVASHGPIDMKALLAQALQMGDEGHNRNRAGTSLIIRELAPHLVMLDAPKSDVADVLRFLHQNDHFFLNLSMGAAKCSADATAGIEYCSVISTMARNGTEFGIRVSGLGERWFCAPSPMVDGLYLPGFSAKDAAPDIGDSVITETVGLGGCAMAASPAIVKFVGGSPQDALATTLSMYQITLAENPAFALPPLDFRGAPTGFDLFKIVDTGIVPAVNTGIAHKTPGIGMVGAGLVKPPFACFTAAARAFCERYS
jgi:hypothetical protein